MWVVYYMRSFCYLFAIPTKAVLYSCASFFASALLLFSLLFVVGWSPALFSVAPVVTAEDHELGFCWVKKQFWLVLLLWILLVVWIIVELYLHILLPFPLCLVIIVPLLHLVWVLYVEQSRWCLWFSLCEFLECTFLSTCSDQMQVQCNNHLVCGTPKTALLCFFCVLLFWIIEIVITK